MYISDTSLAVDDSSLRTRDEVQSAVARRRRRGLVLALLYSYVKFLVFFVNLLFWISLSCICYGSAFMSYVIIALTRGPTDRVLTFDLYLPFRASYGHDPYTCKRSKSKITRCKSGNTDGPMTDAAWIVCLLRYTRLVNISFPIVLYSLSERRT